MERTLRGIAGLVILLSLTLHWFLDGADLERPSWLWLTVFVGFNLLQSAVTNWCPMMWFLQKLGMRRPAHA